MANVVRVPNRFPVALRLVTRLVDGQMDVREGETAFDPPSWRDATDGLRSAILDRFKEPRCLLSLDAIEPEMARSAEHVVLQGLGTRWMKLAPGFVSDDANNGMSDAELQFLRRGLMGSLRPWYLNENSVTEFKDQHGRKVMYTFALAGNPIDPPPSGFGEFRPQPTGPERGWRQIEFRVRSTAVA